MRQVDDKSAQFSSGPTVETQKRQDGKNYEIMTVKCSFSTSPNTAYFENNYVKEKGSWKLLKIQVRLQST